MIDIGATKTLLALFSQRGKVTRRVKFPTAQKMTTFFRELEANLAKFAKRKVSGVVVAAPGVIQNDCTVRFGNRNWGDVDVLSWVKKLFRCPIYLENDANLAAIYEAHELPGRTVYLTFSTGVGGGVVEEGRLVAENFEPGHRIYPYQGATAEWEDIAAASAIVRFYHVDAVTELRGREAMRDVAARVYLGIPDIVAEMRPDTIVIGGPVGRIFRRFSRYLPQIAGVQYRQSERPQEAVIYGGYLYALERDAYAKE